MVVVVVSAQGANVRLHRFDSDPRLIRTHQTTRPNANPEDVESFRRSPATHLRFGFQNAGEARVRGFTA